MKACVFFCSLLLASTLAEADEQVRRTQEELRKRHLYFGDVDGRKTAETSGAIRRYQSRKDLAVTGDLTPETLASLEITAPSNPAEEWPEGIVLKSDVAQQIIESDQKLLEQAEGDVIPPVAEEPRPEPEIAPERPAEHVINTEPPPAAPDANKLTHEFVQSYLAACETNRLESEMEFYADPLGYFENGLVNAAFVARDVERFYRRWPQRRYELLDFKLTKAQGATYDVTFRIAFHYKNAQQSVAGQTLNFFKIRKDSSRLLFTSLKEQRIRH